MGNGLSSSSSAAVHVDVQRSVEGERALDQEVIDNVTELRVAGRLLPHGRRFNSAYAVKGDAASSSSSSSAFAPASAPAVQRLTPPLLPNQATMWLQEEEELQLSQHYGRLGPQGSSSWSKVQNRNMKRKRKRKSTMEQNNKSQSSTCAASDFFISATSTTVAAGNGGRGGSICIGGEGDELKASSAAVHPGMFYGGLNWVISEGVMTNLSSELGPASRGGDVVSAKFIASDLNHRVYQAGRQDCITAIQSTKHFGGSASSAIEIHVIEPGNGGRGRLSIGLAPVSPLNRHAGDFPRSIGLRLPEGAVHHDSAVHATTETIKSIEKGQIIRMWCQPLIANDVQVMQMMWSVSGTYCGSFVVPSDRQNGWDTLYPHIGISNGVCIGVTIVSSTDMVMQDSAELREGIMQLQRFRKVEDGIAGDQCRNLRVRHREFHQLVKQKSTRLRQNRIDMEVKRLEQEEVEAAEETMERLRALESKIVRRRQGAKTTRAVQKLILQAEKARADLHARIDQEALGRKDEKQRLVELRELAVQSELTKDSVRHEEQERAEILRCAHVLVLNGPRNEEVLQQITSVPISWDTQNFSVPLFSKPIGDGFILEVRLVSRTEAGQCWHVWARSFLSSALILLLDFSSSHVATKGELFGPISQRSIVDPFQRKRVAVIRCPLDVMFDFESVQTAISTQPLDQDALRASSLLTSNGLSRAFQAHAQAKGDVTGTPLVGALESTFISDLEMACRAVGEPMIDSDFLPRSVPSILSQPMMDFFNASASQSHSIGSAMNLPGLVPQIAWRRPHQFACSPDALRLHMPVIFDARGADPFDVMRSRFVDNDWLVSCVACVAEFPARIHSLFISKHLNVAGICRMKLCVDGKWRMITIDDAIPCFVGQGPCFARNVSEHVLWVALLEKACAKVFGSYSNLCAPGDPGSILQLLTGCPVESVSFSHETSAKDTDLGEFRRWLFRHLRNEQLVAAQFKSLETSVCGTKFGSGEHFNSVLLEKDDQESKFSPEINQTAFSERSYAIVDAKDVGDEFLIAIRTPMGESMKWNGKWAANSSMWTSKARRVCQYQCDFNERGLIWMNFEEFQALCDSLVVCYLRSDLGLPWHSAQAAGHFSLRDAQSSAHFLVHAIQDSQVMLSLTQPDMRNPGAEIYSAIGVIIVKDTDSASEEDAPLLFDSLAECARCSCWEVSLPRGRWRVIPYMLPSQSSRDEEKGQSDYLAPWILSLFSDDASVARLHPVPVDESLLHECLRISCISHGTIQEVCSLFSVVVLQHFDCGATYCVKCHEDADLKDRGSHILVVLDFEDEQNTFNVFSSSGSWQWEGKLAPGDSQFVISLMRCDPETSWQAGFKVGWEFQPKD